MGDDGDDDDDGGDADGGDDDDIGVCDGVHIIYWPVSELGLTDECLDLGNPFWLAEIPAMGMVPLCH